MALVGDERVDALHAVLQRAGIIDGQPHTHCDKEENQYQADQDLHGNVIWYWRGGIAGVNMKRAEKRINDAGKVLVKKCSEPQLLVHDEEPLFATRLSLFALLPHHKSF